jgi:hypothetical protein
MGKADVPAAPDYTGAAEKQAQSSTQNIEQQTWANRPNQYTPFGSVTWQNTPTWDPATGQWINQWSQNVSLTPDLQAAADAQGQIALGRSNMGVQMLNNASQAAMQGPDYANLQSYGSVPQGGNIQSGFGNAGPALPSGAPQGGNLQGYIAGAGGLQSSIPTYGTKSGVSSQPLQRGVQQTGILQEIGKTGAQANVAGGGNIATGFAPGFGIATEVGLTGQVNNAGPSMGGPVDSLSGQVQRGLNYGGLGDINDLGQGDAARQAMSDAVYQQMASRLDPQWDQRLDRTRSELYNMGLREGDAGYSDAMGDVNRGMNDAYNQAMLSAIQQGGAEQQRQFGMNLAQRQQGVGETNTQGQFSNMATQQAFNQALGAGQFQQGLNQQGFNQGLAQANLQNASNLGMAQFQNAAQAQQYGQNLGQAQFQNQAVQQQFNQNLAQQQAYNQAQQQIFGQNLAAGQFQNAASGQQFNQGLQAGQFANQAAGQAFAQDQANAQLYNQAMQQQYAQALGAGQFANAAQQQQFAQNAAQQQAYNQALLGQFGMGLQSTQMNAALNQQGFGQAQQAAAFNNQAAQQQFAQDQATAAYQNQLRQQQLAEQMQAQGWGLNMINAALAGQQVGMPGMQNFSQASAAQPTQYLSAAGMQYQSALDQFNAQQAASQGLMSGIGSLAGAAMSVLPFALSDERLKKNVRRSSTELFPGVPLASWEWAGDNSGVRHHGVIAQDLEKVLPQFVFEDQQGFKIVDYSFLAMR